MNIQYLLVLLFACAAGGMTYVLAGEPFRKPLARARMSIAARKGMHAKPTQRMKIAEAIDRAGEAFEKVIPLKLSESRELQNKLDLAGLKIIPSTWRAISLGITIFTAIMLAGAALVGGYGISMALLVGIIGRRRRMGGLRNLAVACGKETRRRDRSLSAAGTGTAHYLRVSRRARGAWIQAACREQGPRSAGRRVRAYRYGDLAPRRVPRRCPGPYAPPMRFTAHGIFLRGVNRGDQKGHLDLRRPRITGKACTQGALRCADRADQQALDEDGCPAGLLPDCRARPHPSPAHHSDRKHAHGNHVTGSISLMTWKQPGCDLHPGCSPFPTIIPDIPVTFYSLPRYNFR